MLIRLFLLLLSRCVDDSPFHLAFQAILRFFCFFVVSTRVLCFFTFILHRGTSRFSFLFYVYRGMSLLLLHCIRSPMCLGCVCLVLSCRGVSLLLLFTDVFRCVFLSFVYEASALLRSFFRSLVLSLVRACVLVCVLPRVRSLRSFMSP